MIFESVKHCSHHLCNCLQIKMSADSEKFCFRNFLVITTEILSVNSYLSPTYYILQLPFCRNRTGYRILPSFLYSSLTISLYENSHVHYIHYRNTLFSTVFNKFRFYIWQICKKAGITIKITTHDRYCLIRLYKSEVQKWKPWYSSKSAT